MDTASDASCCTPFPPTPTPEPPQQLYKGRQYREDESDCDEQWDELRYHPELGADWARNWMQRDFVPATVAAVLAACPDEHKQLLGNGPAFGWQLPFDYADPLDAFNVGKPPDEWRPLDKHALKRYNRLRHGPRPPELPGDAQWRVRHTPCVVRWPHTKREENEEEWCRQQCMLHTRWSERDEILHGCATYRERYTQVAERVQRRAKVVCYYSEEEMEAAREAAVTYMTPEEALEIRQAADELQQQSDDDHEGQEAGDQQQLWDDDLETKAGEDMHNVRTRKGASVVSEEETMQPEPEYRASIRSMNKHQKAHFDHLCLWLLMQHIGKSCYPNAPDDAANVNYWPQLLEFLSGGAGVGKSTEVNTFRQFAMRFYRSVIGAGSAADAEEIAAGGHLTVLMIAFTGGAAYNIRGGTLHSCLGIKVHDPDPFGCDWSADELAAFAFKYKHLKLVMVDEVSMLGPEMLRCMDMKFRQAFKQDRIFGGLNVLFVGDLYQIPPIGRHYIFEPLLDTTSIFYRSAWQQGLTKEGAAVEGVKMTELTQIMRQRDALFPQLLNRMREGKLTAEDIQWLQSRVVTPEGGWTSCKKNSMDGLNDLCDRCLSFDLPCDDGTSPDFRPNAWAGGCF